MVIGTLSKLGVRADDPAHYTLTIADRMVDLNPLLGKRIQLCYQNRIYCVYCKKEIKRSFNQGYCYHCFKQLAQCDRCILQPEHCHFHLGTCRDEVWAKKHCMQPHVVYLANTSGLKVGITRRSQLPTRWLDQGAIQAIPVFFVQTRYQSGLLENALRQYVSDRTYWKRMLEANPTLVDMEAERDSLFQESF